MEKIKLKNKVKAQISVFIILAVIVVVVIGLYFIVKGGDINLKNINPQIKPIYSFVENCVEQTGYNAVDYISGTGGYYVLPDLSEDLGISYYLHEGKNYIPSKKQIEDELSLFMNDRLYSCTKEFTDFPDFEIKQEKIQTKAIIRDKEVLFEVNYPLSITKESKSYSLEKFELEVPVRLGIIYNIAKELAEDNKDVICIGCAYTLGVENDLYINSMKIEEEVFIFSIRDENSKINNEALVFNFAIK